MCQCWVRQFSIVFLCIYADTVRAMRRSGRVGSFADALDLQQFFAEQDRSWADFSQIQEGDSTCPAPERRKMYRKPGLDAVEESKLIGADNCVARANVFMCSFPPEGGFFKNKHRGLLDSAVLNADQEFVKNRITGQSASTTSETLWIVEFYADWCPHCKAFAPKWLGLGVALREAGVKTNLVSVNCEVHGDFCQERRVQGYPTIQWFYNGHRADVRNALNKYYKEVSLPNERQSNYQMAHQIAGSNGIPVATAIMLLKQHGIWKDLPEEIPAKGPLSGSVPHTKGEGGLKQLLDVLPKGYSPEELVVEEALSLNLVAEATCPSTRDISDWPVSGWPAGELTATPKMRLAEAGFMLTYTLKKWVTPRVRSGKDLAAFDGDDLSNVMVWTDLLKNNFPLARDELALLHDQVEEAKKQNQEQLCLTDWMAMVRKLEAIFGTEPPTGEAACTTETCRVWTLLHVLSLAPSRLPGALNPLRTSNGIKLFISEFFRCDHCRKHALEQYAAGAYGQDELLSGKGVDGAGIYWWRFHNAVSVRIQAEGECNGDRRWPPADLCPTCWVKSAKSWHVLDEAKDLFAEKVGGNMSTSGALPVETEILQFLLESYWPQLTPAKTTTETSDSKESSTTTTTTPTTTTTTVATTTKKTAQAIPATTLSSETSKPETSDSKESSTTTTTTAPTTTTTVTMTTKSSETSKPEVNAKSSASGFRTGLAGVAGILMSLFLQ